MTFLRKDPMLALFLTSVLLAAAIVWRALSIGLGSPEVAGLWPFIVLCPALLGGYRLSVARVARLRARRAEAPHSEDAERSSRTVGMVARRYLVGVGLAVLLVQALWLAGSYDLHFDPEVMARGMFLVIGGLMAYFGNIVPKTPTPAGADPAAHRLRARLLGRVQVVHGLAVCLGALALDVDDAAAAWPAAIGSMLICSALALAAPNLLKLAKGR